jgi:hypothetical protein
VPPPLEVDQAALSTVVRKAVGSDAAELLTWRRRSIHAPFNQTTGGVHRLSGDARVEGDVVRWSVILKVVRASDDASIGGSADAEDWMREALIYRSGILEAIPGIRAPRCFGVDEVDGAAALLWLEDIHDHVGSGWTPALYRLGGRRLGEFNGAYFTGRALPAAPFLSRRWLRTLVEGFGEAWAQLPPLRHHPLVRRCWPDGLVDRLLGLWQERDAFLEALERLPQTFCHLDAFPRNLLIDGRTEGVVAVDWSFAGIGGVGTEISPMVPASVWFFQAEPREMEGLSEAVLDGYVEGLRAAGWRGDHRLVRFGYMAGAVLHYGLFPLGVLMLDERLRERFERALGHPVGEIADRWAETVSVLLQQADQARAT